MQLNSYQFNIYPKKSAWPFRQARDERRRRVRYKFYPDVRKGGSDGCLFGALLDDNPPEEEVQKFLEKSTVFLHRFSPMRIKPKAPVLTKNQTDFAVLDSRGVLILVEIERPGIRLLKKDGDVSQPLQHAFDQVRAWLDTTRRRWNSCVGLYGL